jgi:hypothetical protein
MLTVLRATLTQYILITVMSCMDPPVRIVTKTPKVELIFSISLEDPHDRNPTCVRKADR